ncbi:MAG: MBL fold metallo-hydrolase [Bacteroidales bacterium]|nr:MBL fold metallo-hydrolase [Clostridia bacterium]MBR1699235.1 MBL fold metallo-hydrolase [Bacteroidales bacterium]
MVIEVPVKGYFAENSFFYIDDATNHGFLIDPGAQAKELLGLIREQGWIIEKILLTHGHFDHMGAVNELRRELGVPVLAHQRSDEYLKDAQKNLSALCGPAILVEDVDYLDDGDVIRLEADPKVCLQVVYAPGHTTDSVLYYSERDKVAFVGDLIFKGSLGTWQYPGGNREDLLKSVMNKVFTLPDDTVLCSGHSEQTTAGIEKQRYL